MRLQGWEQKYDEILHEFGFSKKEDTCAAKFLDSLLGAKVPLSKLECKIRGRTVFVIGAGPSLSSSITSIKKFKKATKIVADGATKALIENNIRPDIVVTDLDGNLEYLKKASKMNSVMVVHSHGDNIGVLPIVLLFRNCIGTTEGRPFGKIRNFGGFTDGDRCVFLAKYFGAKKIVLFGMDFGRKVGAYSKEGRYNKMMKLRKLGRARHLLEWLASKDECELYTTSESIRGFQKIGFGDLQELV
ncbi:MAG: 6-hydroxymethylpterin diphosphokinase MptE-like protein, partial [Nitrosotalea sp.]